MKGTYEEIHDLAQEAEDLRFKTCVVTSGKSTRNNDMAWLVFGKDGRAVQSMGSELRKTLKTRHWGGRAAKFFWKVISSSAVQGAIRTWVVGWLTTGRGQSKPEQVKD